MAIYRTETYQVWNYFFQYFYDSEDQMYYVMIYHLNGGRVKKCEKCATEIDAQMKASQFLEEFVQAKNQEAGQRL